MPYKDIHLFNRSTVSAIMNLATKVQCGRAHLHINSYEELISNKACDVMKASSEQAQSTYLRQELQHGTEGKQAQS